MSKPNKIVILTGAGISAESGIETLIERCHSYARRTSVGFLNLEPSQGSAFFTETRYGPATRLVPEWTQSLLS